MMILLLKALTDSIQTFEIYGPCSITYSNGYGNISGRNPYHTLEMRKQNYGKDSESSSNRDEDKIYFAHQCSDIVAQVSGKDKNSIYNRGTKTDLTCILTRERPYPVPTAYSPTAGSVNILFQITMIKFQKAWTCGER